MSIYPNYYVGIDYKLKGTTPVQQLLRSAGNCRDVLMSSTRDLLLDFASSSIQTKLERWDFWTNVSEPIDHTILLAVNNFTSQIKQVLVKRNETNIFLYKDCTFAELHMIWFLITRYPLIKKIDPQSIIDAQGELFHRESYSEYSNRVTTAFVVYLLGKNKDIYFNSQKISDYNSMTLNTHGVIGYALQNVFWKYPGEFYEFMTLMKLTKPYNPNLPMPDYIASEIKSGARPLDILLALGKALTVSTKETY